jgi:hypothetical protein
VAAPWENYRCADGPSAAPQGPVTATPDGPPSVGCAAALPLSTLRVPSRICRQQAIAWEWSGGGPTVAPMMPSRASRNFAFEPAHIQAMHKAFDAVCVKLQLSIASEDKLTELVGEKVIKLAMAGERNVEMLTARTLAEFGVGNDGSLWRH